MSNVSAENANVVAYLALTIWPLLALYLYSRLPVGQATLWTVLGGYLLLPVGVYFKLPVVPMFNKDTVPALSAVLGCVVYGRQWPKFFRGFGQAEIFILVILVGPFITSIGNGDPIRIGETFLPAVGVYDAGSTAMYQLVTVILPFLLGRQFLRGADSNVDILRVLVIAGLVYSLAVLFEVRMSPQLSSWIYGYNPSSMIVEFRQGGFRPVVFLANGLLVAFFAMTSVVAAGALWRAQIRIGRFPPGGITAYMGVVLVLCKAMGAIVYGALLTPLIRWAAPRLQLRVAMMLVVVALAYPLLRVSNVFPTNTLLDVARIVSVDRASSLNTRFEQEDQLLRHAWERPLFGWGRYGRSRVFHGYLGRDSSLTDGYWIITLGSFGLVGFIATFGLLSLPVFRATMALKYVQSMREGLLMAALGLIVAVNIVDLLPNAPISPWTWLLVGALLGRAESVRAASKQQMRVPDGHLLVGRPTI